MVYLSESLWDLSFFLFVCYLFYLTVIIQQYLGQLDFWHYFIFTSWLEVSHASLDKYSQVSLTKVIMSAELREPILITNSLVFHLLCDIFGRVSAFFTAHCRRKLFSMQVLQENEKKIFYDF